MFNIIKPIVSFCSVTLKPVYLGYFLLDLGKLNYIILSYIFMNFISDMATDMEYDAVFTRRKLSVIVKIFKKYVRARRPWLVGVRLSFSWAWSIPYRDRMRILIPL